MSSEQQQNPLPKERRVDRRAILRGAAVGLVAAAAVPVGQRMLNGPAQASPRSAPVVAAAACGGLPLLGGTEFPIGLFWPPHPFETTGERYAEIREAGFTFVIGGNYLLDAHIMLHAMRMADAVGLKFLVGGDQDVANYAGRFTISDDRSVPMSITSNDARTLATTVLNRYQGVDSFVGWSLGDEPPASRFPTLGRAFAISREVAPNHLLYSNLVPGTGAGYQTMVRSFVDTLKPPLLSFDRYPLTTAPGSEQPGYFENWSIIRSEALRAGIPSWVYIQSVQYAGRRFPNQAELLWQSNLSMAYGCKGIQYFTYWQPDPARGEAFGPALMTAAGERTPLYDGAKVVNTTWLRQVGAQVKPLTSERVVHANELPLPPGAVGFSPDTYITATSGSPVVLGQLRDTTARRWILVANRRFNATATSSLSVHSSVTAVSLFDPASGGYTAVPDRTRIDVSLAPGAAALYRLDK